MLLNFGKPRLEIKRIVLALEVTASPCVFCVFCGSIFLAIGQTALRGARHTCTQLNSSCSISAFGARRNDGRSH